VRGGAGDGWERVVCEASRFRPQQSAKGLAPEREAFLLDQFFAEVMVVKTGIGGAGQLQDAIPHAIRQTAMAGSSAAGVCQSRLPALP
jgi:hypothetical protein